MSKGYINQEQNKNVFEIYNGIRWYRTSDQVKIYKNKYFIKGRMDKVVKIQGYRVDLNDIEKNLRKIKGVDDAIAYLRKTGKSQILLSAIKSKKIKNEDYLLNNIAKKLPII